MPEPSVSDPPSTPKDQAAVPPLWRSAKGCWVLALVVPIFLVLGLMGVVRLAGIDGDSPLYQAYGATGLFLIPLFLPSYGVLLAMARPLKERAVHMLLFSGLLLVYAPFALFVAFIFDGLLFGPTP